MSRAAGVLRAGAAAAAVAGLARSRWAREHVPGGAARWQRRNHRGEPITLLEGPAWALGALAGVLAAPVPARTRAAAALAVTGSALLGGLDDLAEDRGGPARKGLRGHLGALAAGELTTGGAKVAGIGATGLLAAGLLGGAGTPRGRAARALDVLVAGGVVAGSANLVNLLDLRPGRALKVTALAAAPALASLPGAPLAAAALGAGAALAPDDLSERSMLGDAGANAAGALLGVTLLVVTPGPTGRGRAGTLAVLLALTLASERVSFTRVIEGTPGLRELDRAGRRPPSA